VISYTADQAQGRIDEILRSRRWTWDRLVEEHLDYRLTAEERGLAQEIDGLRFLLGQSTLPCCWGCYDLQREEGDD